LTTQDAAGGQGSPDNGAMAMQGIQGVLRAGGLEPAGVAKPGLEQQSIATHQEDKRLPR
jgi:hypothetical protein